MPRQRPTHALLMLATTAAGLASRSGYAAEWPVFFRTYTGDTLWALMVFLTLGFVFPRRPALQIAAASLLIAIAVETGQLFDPPWLESMRNSVAGSILLGHDFMWSDFICYAAGIFAGAVGESAAGYIASVRGKHAPKQIFPANRA